MIRTIIFDLNKVLVTYEDINLDDEFQDIFDISQKDFWTADKEFSDEYYIGMLPFEDYIKRILYIHGIDQIHYEKVVDLYKRGFSLIYGMTDVLKELRDSYSLILYASEGEKMLDWKLNQFKLRHFFDKIYCTCFEGVLKDSSDTFTKIMEENNLKPEETLFIDNQEEYIGIASGLGLHTIHFTNYKELRESLTGKLKK
jgi:FMN phosphatase YigB (HAD superfamily)